jgi:hypothetical protein
MLELSAQGQVYELAGCTVQEKTLAAVELSANNESRDSVIGKRIDRIRRSIKV